MYLKSVIVRKLIIESQVLATHCKTRCRSCNLHAKFRDGSRYVNTIVLIYIYSLDVIYVQITAFSENVVFHKLVCSKVGDLINLYGILENWHDKSIEQGNL
jgi:hypothetical protein